jgi:predicted ArsR family transcriptional regulator
VLLNRLIAVLKSRLPGESLEEILRDVGRELAGERPRGDRGRDAEDRAGEAVRVLSQIGGKAAVEREDDRLFIRSESCPIAVTVAEHPEACRLAEALVAEIVGAKVTERCDRGSSPKCCFEITGWADR